MARLDRSRDGRPGPGRRGRGVGTVEGHPQRVWPTTRHQRCWVHRTANVLACLPKRLHPRAKELLRAIWEADTRTAAVDAAGTFAAEFAKYPKATAKITNDLDVLLASLTSPPSTINICGPPIRSNRPLPPSGCRNGSRAAGPRGSRWRSSSCRPPSNAGDALTVTSSSRWSARARHSSMANYKNAPKAETRRCPPPLDPRVGRPRHPQVLTIARYDFVETGTDV